MSSPTTDPTMDLRAAAAAVAGRVESAMRADLETALAGCDPLLVEVVQYSLFSGGKRIRPLLTVLCSRCCGRDDNDLYLLAAAFEYLHVATLVHDDVIDRASQRRGNATVVARFGLTAAILAGDWLHARSMHLIGRLAGPQGLEIFCAATLSMVNGEFVQLRLIGDAVTKEQQYFDVIRQKTGNLIASTCALGALFAGADEVRLRALSAYGDLIGAAFQVVDDLLDFQGDPANTGKKTGNDFAEGKMTLPLLHTLARANDADRRRIEDLLAADRTDPTSYQGVVTLIGRYDGFASAAAVAGDLVDRALAALAPFIRPGSEDASVRLLRELALYILARNK
ncbi:polyprenyl synthetase family protein [Desulfobulbus sp.]|uniref:polyprenyl synthetase family protein n=1 Tax=Desulfobulbus sp. TaxID=895 RepID=UPI00286EB6AD|nr:polyprenyl synthetase family protein [Desulfobulbus sp.]